MTEQIIKRGLGWRKDKPDPRDFIYRPRATHRPPSVDFRPKLPPCWDQGQLGSCTAFALTGAVAFLHGFVGSQLWLYYKERAIEHTIKQDAGAEIRDGIKVLAKAGLPPEAAWPYDITKFAKAPPRKATAAAKHELIGEYRRLNGLDDYLDCLAAGDPFAIGITLYQSFESDAVAKSGEVQMPQPNEAQIGGHAVCVVGYRENGSFIVRNSWSPDWGDNGHFYLPFAYLANANLASDAWTISACSQ